jgi:hypothetical protein
VDVEFGEQVKLLSLKSMKSIELFISLLCMAHHLLAYFAKFTPHVSQVHFANYSFSKIRKKSSVIFLAHSPHLTKKAHLKNAFLDVKIHKTRGVSHFGLAIHIKKYVVKAKEELWKPKYFTMQKYNLQKIL